MTPSFGGWIAFYIFVKPWLGALSVEPFPFRSWKGTTTEEQLATSLVGYLDLLLVILAAIYVYRRWEQFKTLPLLRTWLVFLGLLLVNCIVVSDQPLYSLRKFLKVLVFFFLYASMYLSVTENRERAVGYVRAILWAAWIPVTYGLVSFLVNAELNWTALANRDYREYSTFIHANPYAYFCVIGLLAARTLWVVRSKRPEGHPGLWVLVLSLLMFLAILSAGARIALATLVIGYVVAGRRKMLTRGAAVAIAVYLLLKVPTFANPVQAVAGLALGGEGPSVEALMDVSEQVSETDLEHTGELAGRLFIWYTMLQELGGDYAFGRGLGSSGFTYEELTGLFLNPHNDYILLAFEVGIGGLVLYWAILIALGRRAWWRRRESVAESREGAFADAVVFCIVFMAVVSLTDNMFVENTTNPMVWGLLGAGTALAGPSSRTRELP